MSNLKRFERFWTRLKLDRKKYSYKTDNIARNKLKSFHFYCKNFIHKCEILLKPWFHAVDLAIQMFVHFFASVYKSVKTIGEEIFIENFKTFFPKSFCSSSRRPFLQRIGSSWPLSAAFSSFFLENLQNYQSFQNIFGKIFFTIINSFYMEPRSQKPFFWAKSTYLKK